MAIRNVRTDGDEVLRKISKKVDKIDDRIVSLLKDMADTMYKQDGVGLAAPQIGILKRLVVIDIGDGLHQLINPKIISESGEQIDYEGCLSVPGLVGEVKRPEKVTVEALSVKGEKIKIEGHKLMSVAICHELDHLDGILFKDIATKIISKKEYEKGHQKKE
jgi:peptide deformylase